MNTIFPGVFHVSQKQGVENEKHFNLRQSLFVFQKWPTEKKIIKKEKKYNFYVFYNLQCERNCGKANNSSLQKSP